MFTPDNSESFALALSTLVFSVGAVAISPALAESGFVWRIVAVVVGAASLGTLFSILRRNFHRSWARPLLGIWIYRTRPHDESKRTETGYGVAEFTQARNGHLAYRVDLYRRPEDAQAAAAGQASEGESHGTAVGLAVAFDPPTGALWILYQVQYYAEHEADREGHLYLRATGPAGQRVLRGSWASDLDGKQLSAGVMTMVRPDDFEAFARRDAKADDE